MHVLCACKAVGVSVSCRAGVEVWSKQATDAGYIWQAPPQHAAGGTDTVDTQPGVGASQQTGPTAESTASISTGPWHPAQGPSQDRIQSLAVCLQGLEVTPGLPQAVGSTPGLSFEQHLERALHVKEIMRLEEATVVESWGAAEVQRLSSLQTVEFTRTQHKLHYLIDGISERFFWHTCIVVDTEPPPAGFVRCGNALGPISTVSMSLAWSSVRALFGLPPHNLPLKFVPE